MKIAALVLLCIPLLAQGGDNEQPAANALDALRSRLDALHSETPLKARVDIHSTRRKGEDAKAKTVELSSRVVVELGAQGLTLNWTPRQIAAARQEEPAPNPNSLSLLEAREAAALLDYAPTLKLLLDGATLLEERDEVWHERPARLLLIRPVPKLTDELRKIVNSHELELKIWLDPAGVPLAMEQVSKLKGSKFLITLTLEERATRQLALAAGRLIVTQAETETLSSGFGDTQVSKTFTGVTLEHSGSK